MGVQSTNTVQCGVTDPTYRLSQRFRDPVAGLCEAGMGAQSSNTVQCGVTDPTYRL